jgi:tetratricopeptide (TPR) repeat protein
VTQESAEVWRQRAAGFRNLQQMENALDAMERASRLDPRHAQTRFALALLNFETWRPSADLFEHAHELAPGNLSIIHNHAAALAAEGDPSGAEDLLERALLEHPGWFDGHRVLATLRITLANEDPARSFAYACDKEPQNLSLRLAWFHFLATTRNWNAVRSVIAGGRKLLGDHRAFTVADIFIESESGERADDLNLFDQVKDFRDPGLDLCHIRHLLRLRRADEAEAIAQRNIGTMSEAMFWPYLSLAWRLQGKAEGEWLDGSPLHARAFDLDFEQNELRLLAETLRSLHRMKAPYPEQSVRGGTQTDRQLFFHPSPIIQTTRTKIAKAIRAYIDALPPPDPAHPLLAQRRDSILFEGSWSVRLTAQGFHSCHTHTQGWISSAFYVALPDADAMGPPPSGWLALGTPPPELNLGLDAHQRIEPKLGRLVLFPSTMWHGTLPFADGERLTLAFDVKRPR